MNKEHKSRTESSSRREYDFTKGVRGKYAKRFGQGTTLIPLAADVAKDFPDAAAVNKALRAYRRILKAHPS